MSDRQRRKRSQSNDNLALPSLARTRLSLHLNVMLTLSIVLYSLFNLFNGDYDFIQWLLDIGVRPSSVIDVYMALLDCNMFTESSTHGPECVPPL